ncbi:glycoside hydrolase family 10 protein [Piromyces sp. E2]|nr:glycoside hydrolase family 10 protein [Piromyces sp. E2]|eukprot:OUM57971.1 glycoside hydrolase family 10 protein [Piromyces sp. E2]
MGVGIYGSSLSTSGMISKKMRDIIEYQFNSITYTNLMKMDYMLNKSASQANAKNGNDMPVLKFDTIIDGLEFCKINNIHMRGHTLVWHVQAPGSFDSSTGWNTRTKFESGKNDNLWYKTMGPDYVFKAFRFARKYADKDVKLVYNDFNTFMSQKTNAISTLVKKLKAENLIDAVGLQSYLGATWPAVKDYKSAIQKFSSLGVDIQVTELTISTDGSGNKFNQQASRYQEVFKVYMELKKSGVNITSVTLFGLQDGYLIYDNDTTDTRFWDHDLKKKPVYNAVMQVLKS